MRWQFWILVALVLLGGIGEFAEIGKPRKPVTVETVAARWVGRFLWLALIVWGATS